MPIDLLDAIGQNAQQSGAVDLLDAIGSKQQPKKAVAPTPGHWGLAEELGNGMAFGMAPKIVSAMSAPAQYGIQAIQEAMDGKNIPPHQSVADLYGENLQNIRAGQSAHEKDNPVKSNLANIFGGFLNFNPNSSAVAVQQSLPKLIAKGAALGIPMGGIPAFVNADGSWADKAKSGTVGGLVGGVVGAAVPAVMAGVPMAYRALTRPFTQSGQEEIAGNVINKMAGSGGINLEPQPLPGMELTTGQQSNNPGILSLERTLQQRNAAGGGNAMMDEASRLAANNAAITSGVKQVGDVNANSSAAIEDRLTNAYDIAKKANSALWKAADTENTGGVSGFQFKNFMNNHIDSLPIAERSVIPEDVMSVMDKMAEEKTQNLSDVQAVRSMLSGRARMAARSGDMNTARMLNGVGDQVENFIDQRASTLGSTLPKYNTARQDTAWMKSTFNQPPGVRDVLGLNSFGADKVPRSAVADKFITTGKGGPEALNAYLEATGGEDPAKQALRDAFAKRFLDNIQQTTSDIGGNRNISAAATTNFVDNYDNIINSKVFTQPQRDLINNIQKAADMASRTMRAGPKGGSDTAAKLLGSNFLDVLVGPGASKIIPAAGAAIGMSHGPVGMAVGALAGKGVERGLSEALPAAPRDKVIELLNQAIADPKIAQALMMKATAGNSRMIGSATAQKIISILGTESAGMLGRATPEVLSRNPQYPQLQAAQ